MFIPAAGTSKMSPTGHENITIFVPHTSVPKCSRGQNDAVWKHSPVPVFIFICVGEELWAGQRQVQSGQGQISVAKAEQLDRWSQTRVLILHWLRDDLQVGQTHLLRFAAQHKHGQDTETHTWSWRSRNFCMLELLADSLYKMWTVKIANGAMTNGRATVSSHTHSSAQSNRRTAASHTHYCHGPWEEDADLWEYTLKTMRENVTKTDSFERCFHTSVGVLFSFFKNVLKFVI